MIAMFTFFRKCFQFCVYVTRVLMTELVWRSYFYSDRIWRYLNMKNYQIRFQLFWFIYNSLIDLVQDSTRYSLKNSTTYFLTFKNTWSYYSWLNIYSKNTSTINHKMWQIIRPLFLFSYGTVQWHWYIFIHFTHSLGTS